PALSAAVQVMLELVLALNTSPPFGIDTVIVGGAMSRNVDVTVLSALMSRLSGLFVLTRSPLHAENAQPELGLAVSCTEDPFAYDGWSGSFVTVPPPTMFTVSSRALPAKLAAMV